MKKIMAIFAGLWLWFLGFLGLIGVPFTLSGATQIAVGSAFSDLWTSLLLNFVTILQLAIPLIVILAIIVMIKKYFTMK